MNKYYWMNRNYRGLDKIGYLLSEEDLKREDIGDKFKKAGIDISDLIEKGDEQEGAYDSNDTFVIRKVSEDEAIRLVSWIDFVPTESVSCSELTAKYPYYVPEDLRLPVCMYFRSAFTSTTLPRTEEKSKTLFDFIREHEIHRLCYPYTFKDQIKSNISIAVQKKTLTRKLFRSYMNELKIDKMEEILSSYEYEEDYMLPSSPPEIYKVGNQEYFEYRFYEAGDFNYALLLSREDILIRSIDSDGIIYDLTYTKDQLPKLTHNHILDELEGHFPELFNYTHRETEDYEYELE